MKLEELISNILLGLVLMAVAFFTVVGFVTVLLRVSERLAG